MEIVLLLILVFFLVLFGVLGFKLLKWIFTNKKRQKVALAVFSILSLALIIHHLFFKKMHFIQSNVYHNLYLITYPERDPDLVQKAIREKIKEHLQTQHTSGKRLSYSGENAIYFYEYYKQIPFALFQDAGTYYFLEHEEDLGGFVSEELGMYTQYRMAEFYVEPCPIDTTWYCGEINYFHEGDFLKAVFLKNLAPKK